MLFKKLTAVLTSLVTAAGMFVFADDMIQLSKVSAASGDINLNQKRDIDDVSGLQKFLTGKKAFTVNQLGEADLNDDGKINVFDLILLKRNVIQEKGLGDYAGLVINEVCSSNSESFKDAAGESVDWIEIYNSTDKDLVLDGIGVSDGAKKKFKFAFPENTVIGAGEYLIVCCDDAVNQAEGEYHAAFKLSADGETVYLTHPELGEIDSVTLPVLDTDITYGRYENGTGEFTCLTPTPLESNDNAQEIIDPPVFSAEGGFYGTAFDLSISDSNSNEIYYTTDGSDPRTSATAKLYSDDIYIYNNTSSPNKYSALTDITLNNYVGPSENVDKGMIIRVASKDSEGNYSKVITNSYFVGKTASYYNEMKVVSISTDGDYLFDPDNGFYMLGKEWFEYKNSPEFVPYDSSNANDTAHPTNYNKDGKNTEFPANVQVFENGKLAFTEDVGARISGNWSRGYPQKSIRLYARGEYGSSKMSYEFIDGMTDENGDIIEEFDKITFRNAGTDNQNLHFRDALLQDLLSDRNLDVQGAEPCVLFIDGEFWGFYFIREKLDADYVEAHYGIDKDDVTVLKNGEVEDGSEEIAAEYDDFCKWAATADMTAQSNYQKVCDTLDIQSFMDFITIETYINNADWATDYLNNWQMWRSNTVDPTIKGADGKWRFIMYDLDFSADWFDDPRTFAGFDSLNGLYNGDAPYNFVKVFYNLMNNETFRDAFYETYTDIMTNNFSPSKVSAKIDEYVAAYGKAIYDTNVRFDSKWANTNYDSQVETFRNFFYDRPAYAKTYLDFLYGMETEYGENLVPDVSQWTHYGTANYSYNSAENSFTAKTSSVYANPWDTQAQARGLKLEKGKVYRLSFEASCTENAAWDIGVIRQQGTSYPGIWYGTSQLTPELQKFSYTFAVTDITSSEWFLFFNYGMGAGTYTVKNVTLTEVLVDTEQITGSGVWEIYNPNGGSVLTAGADNKSFTVNTTVMPDNYWESQAFYGGIQLKAGNTYTYEFRASADVPSKIKVCVQQNYGEYISYSEHEINIDSPSSGYKYSFTAPENCANASICFSTGYNTGTVNISDISFK